MNNKLLLTALAGACLVSFGQVAAAKGKPSKSICGENHTINIAGTNKSDVIIVDSTTHTYTLNGEGPFPYNPPAVISGGNGKDTITGSAEDDVICGGNGNDTIQGNAGSDTILGQNGKDILFGDSETEACVAADAQDPNGIPNDGDEIAAVTCNDFISGENGKDTIVGGEGDDTLYGGNAPDDIDGGLGFDSINGGRGKDTCVAESTDADVIEECELP